MAKMIAKVLAAICLFSFTAWPALSANEQPNDPDEPEEPESAPEAANPLQTKYPGLLIRSIKIADTDPDLAEDHRTHWTYYQPNVKHIGQLLVGLPGTHGRGSNNSAVDAIGAQLGYHTISLTYRSGTAVAIFAHSADPDAYLKGRENIIYGSAPIGPLKVDKPNSIINRLVKALIYLDKTYPKEGWGAYVKGDQPVWQKIAFSGLSQGGGHACLLGVQHPVARVVMFGAPKDYSVHFHHPATWLSTQPKTPVTRFFCFVHSGDEHHGCTYKEQVENYKALRLSPRFPIVDVENEVPPYGHTRLLTCHTPADIPKHNHGMVAGASMFAPVWKYMLSEPCP